MLITFWILLVLQEATWCRDLSVAVGCFSLKLKSHTRVGGVSVLLQSFSRYYQPQQQPADSLKDICGVISSFQLADVHCIQVAPKCHRSPLGTDPAYRCHFFHWSSLPQKILHHKWENLRLDCAICRCPHKEQRVRHHRAVCLMHYQEPEEHFWAAQLSVLYSTSDSWGGKGKKYKRKLIKCLLAGPFNTNNVTRSMATASAAGSQSTLYPHRNIFREELDLTKCWELSSPTKLF